MLTVKTWCLPSHLTEEQLNKLHNAIVYAVTSFPETGVSSERDMLNLFPPDMMRYGLGTEILIEITNCNCNDSTCMHLAESVGKAVKALFPKAHIVCTVTSKPIAEWSQ